MSAKYLVPLLAATALLTACNQRDDADAGVHSDSPNGTGAAAADDTTASPGTTATPGEPPTPAEPLPPPSDTAIPTDTPPPSEVPPQ